MNSKYLIDSSAWLAYLKGSDSGARIHVLIEKETLAVSIISIAELADKFERESRSFVKTLRFIEAHAAILPLTIDIACVAAKIKRKQLVTKKKFGFADAIHLATAQTHSLTLVTTDQDFCGSQGVMVV
jgi:predicted nucleic acid-binding protein